MTVNADDLAVLVSDRAELERLLRAMGGLARTVLANIDTPDGRAQAAAFLDAILNPDHDEIPTPTTSPTGAI